MHIRLLKTNNDGILLLSCDCEWCFHFLSLSLFPSILSISVGSGSASISIQWRYNQTRTNGCSAMVDDLKASCSYFHCSRLYIDMRATNHPWKQTLQICWWFEISHQPHQNVKIVVFALFLDALAQRDVVSYFASIFLCFANTQLVLPAHFVVA